MNRFLLALFGLLLGLSAEVQAGSCLGDSAEARFLPRLIGRPHSSIRTPFLMPCDTMEVRIGDTVTIHPGVMLHFGPDSRPENVILVRGRLEVLGSDEAPVYFSGTLSEGDFGLRPGNGPWGGFRIDPVGEADFRHARIWKAVPALDSKSEHVRFSKVVFKQSLDARGPFGQAIDLEFKETRVESMDFAAARSTQDTAVAAQGQKPDAKVAAAPSRVTTWSLLGGGTILAGAGLFWYLSSRGDDTPGPSANATEYPDRPGFPGTSSR